MAHELLGQHKPSSEWYTPDWVKDRVKNTFGTKTFTEVYDPCPVNADFDGLSARWINHRYVYCNPPIPLSAWAKKAVKTVQNSYDTDIIFAAYSEAVLWQVPELWNYPVCLVRNRITWIDGNRWAKKPNGDDMEHMIEGRIVYRNTRYMKEAKSPRNYNAFILISNDGWEDEKYWLFKNFREQFGTLGRIIQDR